MGLLDAVESLTELEKTGNKSPEKILDQLRQWRNTFLSREPGFDIFYRIFNDLASILRIEKGLLLSFSRPEKEFVPWSAKGYDKTTLGRIHIKQGELKDISDIDKSAILLPKTKLDPFKTLFSVRDFSLIEQLLIIPFFYESNYFSYLVITDSPLIKTEGKNLFEMLKIIGEAGKHIHTSRESRLDSMKISARFLVPDQKKEILHYIETEEFQKYHLCRLPLQGLIDELKGIFPFITENAVKSDSLVFFSSFLAESGAVFDIPGREILLIIKQERFPDRDLFFHQSSYALKNLYTEMIRAPQLSPDCQLINGADHAKNLAILETLLNESL